LGEVIREADTMILADHRVNPRAHLRWSVSLEFDGTVTEGVTKDISEGGAYVCCATPLAPKEEFSMVIHAPAKKLHVRAEVVWTNTYGFDEEITPRGMGVRFTNITGEDRRIIARAVSENLAREKLVEDLQTSMLDTLEIE
jgi:c-di-GMP-binding flagellar brake protein YcgR